MDTIFKKPFSDPHFGSNIPLFNNYIHYHAFTEEPLKPRER